MKAEEHAEQRVLRLTLKQEYFEKIVEGRKPYEFRDLTDYWKSRLEGRKYDAILFRNGYHEDAPEMLVEFLGCEKWSHSYAIKLGRIIELKRWPPQHAHDASKGPKLEE